MGETVMTPVHPGEVLAEDFLEPLGVTQHGLAVAIGVPPRRINEIVHGKRRVTADTALRLSRFFGTSERFWLNLQSRYDLEVEKDKLAESSLCSGSGRWPAPEIVRARRAVQAHNRCIGRGGVSVADPCVVVDECGHRATLVEIPPGR